MLLPMLLPMLFEILAKNGGLLFQKWRATFWRFRGLLFLSSRATFFQLAKTSADAFPKLDEGAQGGTTRGYSKGQLAGALAEAFPKNARGVRRGR